MAQPGQSVFALVMCGRAGWHCSQSLEPNSQTRKQRDKSETFSPRDTVRRAVMRKHRDGVYFCTHTAAERDSNIKSWDKSISVKLVICESLIVLLWWFAPPSPAETCQTVFAAQRQNSPWFSVDTFWRFVCFLWFFLGGCHLNCKTFCHLLQTRHWCHFLTKIAF